MDFFKPFNIEKKISISSKIVFVYIVYFLFILATIFLDFFCKAVKLPQGSLVSRLIVIFSILFLIVKFWKAFEIKKLELSNYQITIGLAVILVVTLLKIVYPDVNYDTLNYHLIAQRQGFVNYFSEQQGFAKGNFQVWGFSYGDKAFWYFRFFLGYRLGTILNSIVLFITYFQVICILDILFPHIDKTKIFVKDDLLKTLFSVFIVTSHYLLLNIGTYMVDALVFPFILEGTIILLNNYKCKTITHCYFAILMGLALALKLTNIVYILPLCLIYIYKNRKYLSIQIIITCGLLIIIPCLPFLVYSFYVTKNPVFPYYNNIFNSPYFQKENWKDVRWGPESIKQAVYWLYIFVFKPSHRSSEIYSQYNFLFVLGFLGGISWFFKFAKKNNNDSYELANIDLLALTTIGMSLCWSFTTGYARYFEIGMIFMGIFAYYFISIVVEYSKKIIRPSIVKGIKILCITVLFFESFNIIKSFENGREWSWRHFTKQTFKENVIKLWNDKNFTKNNNEGLDMTFFITTQHYCGIADALYPKAKIVNHFYKGCVQHNRIAIPSFDDSKVYDIVDLNFTISDDYKNIFADYGYKLNCISEIQSDLGVYKLIEFKKD